MTEGAITIEQLIDIVNQDLTFSNMFPKILPEQEIYRIIKEHSLEWFYNNYQYAVHKGAYIIDRDNLYSSEYLDNKYFILPEEIENVTNVRLISDHNAFQLGIAAPHLSINLGVTNQPYLTSFVTTAGDLAIYKSVVGGFADELNKMVLESVKFSYNPVNKRLTFLSRVKNNLVLEVNTRVEQEELFDLQLFKDYVIGMSRKRLGEALKRYTNLELPGGFSYDADSIIKQGEDLITEVKEKIKGMTTTGWFTMSR